MPNWCANSLSLTATNAQSEQKLSEIVQELSRAQSADEEPKFCELIKPVPPALLITAGHLGDEKEQAELEKKSTENLKTYGYANWYDFCVVEWGTKWDIRANPNDFEFDGKTLTFHFDTAWSPPMGIYYALEEMGFTVQATYIEQGMGYLGYYTQGEDVCEKIESIYQEADDDEDHYEDMCLAIENYFDQTGFEHSPIHFGG